MCGLSAIIGEGSHRIKEMNDLIAHRGPDAEDFHRGQEFALGHRRLSILDLSPDGKQPMLHKPTGNLIVFNGEIYNYLELRDELKNKGHEFHTGTDTEVILAAYSEWGEDCSARFNGMWTFVLFDKNKDQFFISRDRFGVKPLYIYQDEKTLALGSEIKQLLIFTEKKVNLNYLNGYLVTGLLDYSNETFFQKIMKVPPSQNFIVDRKTRRMRAMKYFQVKEEETRSLRFEDALKKFSDLFKSSIQLRLRSDVKVGTCLSGGLDSSTVAAMASDSYTGGKFQGIFAQSLDPNTDESHYANLVASHKGIELNTIKPTFEDFVENIDEVIYTQEEPFVSPSIFMQYFVMKKAKELGCKVMLDGQGGDETLLGYEKYYPAVLYEKWKDGRTVEFVKFLSDTKENNSRFTPLKMFIYFFGMVSWRVRLLAHCYQARILKPHFFFNNYWYLKTLSRCVMSSAFSLQRFEIFHTNLPSLLRYEDKNSMRHSIEARLPFLDYRLVQNNINLPSEFKIKQGWSKYILRKFLDGKLPEEVIWRKKKLGFEAPTTIWLKQHEEAMKKEILDSKILQYISTSRLKEVNASAGMIFWRLYNVAVWERVYKVIL